jgi:predicted transcriptional regulator
LALGELQAEVLGTLQRLGKASARDIMRQIGSEKRLAYTTVSTVLDRLHKRGLVKRTKVAGRGGEKYVYQVAAHGDIRNSFVQRTLSSLVNAFGPSVVPTIYESLEQLSKDEVSDLKKKVSKARRQ